MSRPNVLFLMSDQHNAKCLGCYGHDIVQTPNLDRLAQRGVRFTSAFTQNPICTPSRMCYLTSQYVHNHGYYGLKGPTPPRLPNMFSQLRTSGYYTGAIGKIHLPDGWIEPDCDFLCGSIRGEDCCALSYKEYLQGHGVNDAADDVMKQRRADGKRGQSIDGRPDFLPKDLSADGYGVEMAREFFRRWQGESGEKPFFLWFTLSKPHQEYKPAQEFWDLYDDNLPMPPNADDDPSQKIVPFRRTVNGVRQHPPADLEPRDYESLRRRKLRGYYGNITHMDWAMGQVLDMLEATGATEDTLVIYCTDHGDYACEHGILEKAPGINSDAIGRIPFIWSWPGHLPEGEVRDQIVETLDVWPTVAHFAELGPMSMWDGKEISEILLHDGAEACDAAFTENPFIKCITTRRWRMTVVPAGMYPDDPVEGELYDREKDPWERTNLYHHSEYATIVEELRGRLLDWMVTSQRPVTALPIPPHPSMEGAERDYMRSKPPFPEDGRTSPMQMWKAVRENRDNYL